MKNNLFSLLFFFVLLLLGCNTINENKSKETAFSTININPEEKGKPEDFFNQIESIRFLSLENTSTNPIDYLKKIWITNNEIMVMTGNDEFHKYTHSGQFILKKTIEGKGKAEVNSLYDFSAGKNGDFYILSYKEYYHFDKNGEFLNTYPLSFPNKDYNPTQFIVVNDTYQIYCAYETFNNGTIINESEYYSMCIQNNQSNTFKQMLYRHTCIIADNTIVQCNDNILINPILGNDTIYIWNGNDVKPLYYIDFGKYKIPVEEIPQDYSNPFTMFRYAADNNKCTEINMGLMCEDWLLFYFRFGKESFLCCYNKNKNDYVLLSLSDERIESLFLDSRFLAVKNNEFILSIPAYRIKERIEINTLDFRILGEARHQEIIDQLKKVKETDNPVLMFVKMKPE